MLFHIWVITQFIIKNEISIFYINANFKLFSRRSKFNAIIISLYVNYCNNQIIFNASSVLFSPQTLIALLRCIYTALSVFC